MMQATDLLDLPTASTSVCAAAEMYAAAGFPVVPIYGIRDGVCTCGDPSCQPRSAGKHPVGKAWQRHASSEIDAVRDLFRGHDGNIGIVLGTRYVVLDVDGDEGRASIAELGYLPETLTSRSGSGGEHRVFRYAAHQNPNEVTNRRIAPGLDIKTRNGQIVVSPSMHRSGERYTWALPIAPAVLPDELYERIRKQAATVHALRTAPRNPGLYERAEKYLDRIPGAISGSGGHDQTFAAARALVGWLRKGLPESDCLALLQSYNTRCEPPWTARELRHKWEQAQAATDVPEIQDRPQTHAPAYHPDAPPALAAEPSWQSRCLWESKKGANVLRKHHENVVAILRYHPAWKERVRYNVHLHGVTVSGAPWHESNAWPTDETSSTAWTDQDTARLSSWLVREPDVRLDIGISECDRAVEIAARAIPYHPIRDYLDGLKWDSVPRLAHVAHRYLGTPASPYASAVMRWWLTSAVARAFEPGCKADHVLILEGPQGLRKSSALKVLAGLDWFTDAKIDITRKDAFLQMHGKWVIELAELASVKGADTDALKAFFTHSHDTYVPPYGRRSVTIARECVFAGTVNPANSYLRDRTGNRRFWPIECTAIDLEGLERDRDQIWAEAVHWYRSGGHWWPETEAEHALCSGQQEQREDYDEWENRIDSYLQTHGDFVTVGEVLDSIGVEMARQDRASQMRVSGYLRRLGWVKTIRGDTRKRGWARP